MNTNAYVFFPTGGGAPGATVAARNLYAMLRGLGRPCAYDLVEIDGQLGGLNETLMSGARRIQISEHRIATGDETELDGLFRPEEDGMTIILDFGANTLPGFEDWTEQHEFFKLLSARGNRCWFAFVAPSGGQGSRHIAERLHQLAGKHASWLFLRAWHTGDDFAAWDELAGSMRAATGNLPLVPRSWINRSYQRGEPFALLARAQDLNVLQAARCKRYARLYAEAFAPLIDTLPGMSPAEC